MAKIENKKPEIQYRAGQVTASVWKNIKEVNKKQIEFFSVTITKNYTQDDGKTWETTNSFNREDLIKVQLVTSKAIEYIYLKETE